MLEPNRSLPVAWPFRSSCPDLGHEAHELPRDPVGRIYSHLPLQSLTTQPLELVLLVLQLENRISSRQPPVFFRQRRLVMLPIGNRWVHSCCGGISDQYDPSYPIEEKDASDPDFLG